MDETWTIGRVLTWTASHFAEKGMDSPRLDAELLIADALTLTRLQLYTQHDQPLNAPELASIRERVRRRMRREPVAYITGTRGFWSLDLQVDRRVLVPRPETELLVERASTSSSPFASPASSTSAPAAGASPSPSPASAPTPGCWPSTPPRRPRRGRRQPRPPGAAGDPPARRPAGGGRGPPSSSSATRPTSPAARSRASCPTSCATSPGWPSTGAPTA
ncbi:MAG: hypothetical protein R3F43_16090 [bacterium]